MKIYVVDLPSQENTDNLKMSYSYFKYKISVHGMYLLFEFF